MVEFSLTNPTRIAFGKGSIASLSELVPAGTKVLLLYGGGSIKRNGIYDQVVKSLSAASVVEFGGIEVNPHYETIMDAVKLARNEAVDLVLAVGGGSVVDAGKFLAAAARADGDDPWDQLFEGKYPSNPLPVGAVLTLPATGSESNPVSVITSTKRKLKVPFASDSVRPKFAILDPETMATLDRRQLSNGTVDAFTHVLEQYVTIKGNTPIQYGFSESILETLIEWGPVLVEKNTPEARENIMWAANQALNGLIGAGVRQDWSTHMIGHALTELYGVDHARSLSVIMGSVLRYKLDQKQAMLARYGRRVWKLEGEDDAEVARSAIDLTEDFFRRMEVPVGLASLDSVDVDANDVVSHLERAGQTALGEAGDIGPEQVRAILDIAAAGDARASAMQDAARSA